MKLAIILFTLAVAGFGLMLTVRRAIESYKIGDWWGIMGQTFILLATVAILTLVLFTISNTFP